MFVGEEMELEHYQETQVSKHENYFCQIMFELIGGAVYDAITGELVSITSFGFKRISATTQELDNYVVVYYIFC